MKFSTERPYLWLFALLAVVGLATDQASKYIIFAKLYPDDRPVEQTIPLDVIPNYFALQTSFTGDRDPGDLPLSFLRNIGGDRIPHVNKGALFGIGNHGAGMNPYFAALSVLAACFIVFWALRPNIAKDRFLCVALGLILGGTLGNFFDRIVFSGVRDFLHVDLGFSPFSPWPTFNIADCCLVCGAGVLLAHSILVAEPKPQSETAEPVAAGATQEMPAASPSNGA